jgi:stage IV sporulation protein FB
MFVLGSTVSVIAAVFSTFIHELGHILFIFWNSKSKNNIKEVNIKLFGIDIIQSNEILDCKTEILTNLSGPLANFLFSVLCLVLNIHFESNVLEIFCYESLAIGLMNLLPIASFDGGEILFILLKRHCCLNVAEKIAFLVSVTLLFPLATLGFLLLLQSRFNFSLLFLSFYLILLIFSREEHAISLKSI